MEGQGRCSWWETSKGERTHVWTDGRGGESEKLQAVEYTLVFASVEERDLEGKLWWVPAVCGLQPLWPHGGSAGP